MRRHPILWLLAGAYLLLVGIWPAAAAPVALAALGAFTVLLQPPVLAAVVLGAVVVSALRHTTHRPARAHH